ncbi:hypothetical protein DR087_00545 [Mycoplasma hyopneumoniae]|nr:hypothetical protein [Mesomycoplasma hyopneumoniae]
MLLILDFNIVIKFISLIFYHKKTILIFDFIIKSVEFEANILINIKFYSKIIWFSKKWPFILIFANNSILFNVL